MVQAAAKSQSHSLERLRKAARTLFVRDGYHQTRPQDIAREAGVANGTFYLHFKDKREAFLDFAAEAQNELLAEYRARLEGISKPRERLRAIFNTIVEFGTRNPGVMHAAFLDPVLIAPNEPDAWRMYDRMGQLLYAVVNDSDIANLLDRQFNLELISHALCGMFGHAMTYAVRKELGAAEVIDELMAFIERALPLGSIELTPQPSN